MGPYINAPKAYFLPSSLRIKETNKSNNRMRNQNLNLGNQVSHEITVNNNRPHLQAPNANEDGLARLILLKQFKDMRPPMFQGLPDPTKAEQWLKQVDKIFDAMGSIDEQRVKMTKLVQGSMIVAYSMMPNSLSWLNMPYN